MGQFLQDGKNVCLVFNVPFLDAQASLAPTQVSLSVRPSVRRSHFRISNLSASLVAFREKLKREDPNYFFNIVSGCFWPKNFFDSKTFFWPKNFFDPKTFSTKKLFGPKNFFDPNTRARWHNLISTKYRHIISLWVNSYVKLNFKASLFSCIFWFEAIFIGKSTLLVFGVFTL